MNLKLTNKYEVLTPFGWNSFDGIKQTKSPFLIKIKFDNHDSIRVTPNHIFIVNGKNIIANDLKIFDVLESKNGLIKIMDINREINNDEQFSVYDLYNIDNINHSYYTNKIISHNCCDFILSGETIIEPQYIAWIRDNLVREPLEKQGQNQEFWIWKYPEKDKNYIVSADVAKGNEGDYSGAQVICIETFEQVAEFKSNKVDAERFGQMLCEFGSKYNNALLIPENNNFGQRTIQKIIDSYYPKLFWYDKKFKGLVFPESRETFKMEQKEPGWPTTIKNRSIVLENLIALIRELAMEGMKGNPGGVTIYSSRLCDELDSWGYYNGRFDHKRNEHDDLIFALAIGCFVKTVYNRIGENSNSNAVEFMKFFSNDKQNMDMSFGIQNPKIRIDETQRFLGEDISWLLLDNDPKYNNQ